MIAANLLTLAVAAAGAVAAPLQKRAYSGTATYYAAGLGACGGTNSGSDFIVALNAPTWGTSDGQRSSHCDQQVVITNNKNGNTQTATVVDLCPGCGYGSLDMSTGLFAALNNGNMDDGVFPITWHWAGESAPAPAPAQEKPKPKPTPKETKTKEVASATPTQREAKPTHSASSTSAAAQPQATGSATTVVTTPERWSKVDNTCNFTADEKTLGVAIGPSALLSKDDLWKACGKWIQIENNQNGKSLSVQVVSYLPEAESTFLAIADGYTWLSNVYGDYVEPIKSLTWGFIDGQDI
ncbi:uncharacterized protein PFL1_02866 [Pseudozyma flocculosa PF-1]|uniref:Barwin domain-containing protein n=2 Tax=Pseudozyma flocculosa TaxID=84751 RepID=A0A5C3F121_9BASI|nr:uncharacterized protein PFL1_02866 [Pseudozyma flocculosa PF-1]EPQ29646.1 hypothetical protein PFL1_02866 [Pseudozyma flocculosa PF-1]SPO38214.1 uncharacterized protein PSFLO_03691 [Pseudozyma flocculosa]